MLSLELTMTLEAFNFDCKGRCTIDHCTCLDWLILFRINTEGNQIAADMPLHPYEQLSKLQCN